MTQILFHYHQAFAVWDELRFALRSIEKNFRDDFEVMIVGDKPEWLTGVTHIPHERIDNGSSSNLFDALTKIKLALKDPRLKDSFIRWYDDCYLLKPMNIEYFQRHWVLYDMTLRRRADYSLWHQSLWKTFDVLFEKQPQVWNCESHLPRFFETQKLIDIFKTFGLPQSKLLLETLYFNHYPPGEPVFLSKEDHVKAGFYGTDDIYSSKIKVPAQIKQHLKGKQFLNHNDAGLSIGLKQVISKLFPHKSRFEK